MSKNIWESFDEFLMGIGKYITCEEEVKAFFRQKFEEIFDEIERRSFKDKEHSNFRIIGDETFKEIKKKYN